MNNLFINKFINSITAAKKRKVIDIVNKKKGDTNSSLSAISASISKELAGIDTSNSNPISKPIGFTDSSLIDASYMQKFMIDTADDVFILMTALQSIELLNKSHDVLFTKFLFPGLETSIRQLQKRLNAARLIKNDVAIGTTSFRQQDSIAYKPYSSISETRLIYDNQKAKNFTEKELLSFDTSGALFLPLSEIVEVNQYITDVYKKFPGTSVSEKQVIIDGSDLSNILDMDSSTFFREVNLSKNELSNGYTLVVTLEIDHQAKINRLTIVPFGDSRLRINRISYDNKKQLTPIYDTTVTPYDQNIIGSDIQDETIVDFGTITATHVHIEFVQKTYSVVNFDESISSQNITALQLSDNTYVAGASYLNEFLPPAISSNAISDRYYSYETAIADIGLGHIRYRDSGVYIYDEEKFNNVLQIGIASDVTVNQGLLPYEYSVEYYMSASVNTGKKKPTVFTAQIPVSGSSVIKQVFYSNIITLTYDVDNISNISIYTLSGIVPGAEYSMTGKTITLSTAVSNNAPYIVVYSPSFVTSPEKRYAFSDSGILSEDIDKNGDVGIDEDGMIVLFSTTNDVTVQYSVIIRDLVGGSFIKVNNVDLVYNSFDTNRYRFK